MRSGLPVGSTATAPTCASVDAIAGDQRRLLRMTDWSRPCVAQKATAAWNVVNV